MLCTGHQLRPPAVGYEALLAFRFGDPDPGDDPHVVHIPLATIGEDNGLEQWWYRGVVDHGGSGPVRTASCADFFTVVVQMSADECQNVRQATHDAYALMFDTLDTQADFEFARIWNFLGGINEGRDDLERYRQFSMGRADAFHVRQISDIDSPVGTAIGTPPDQGLVVVGLASHGNLRPVENPRQVSAFNYPRQYGPQSPKFSRSGILNTRESALFLISGTAAVVGHESAFPFEAGPQIDATLRNLESLTGAVSKHCAEVDGWHLGEQTCLRVYLRDPSDYGLVREAISAQIAVPSSQVIYLQGDICRRELMVEIEACSLIEPDRVS